MMIAERLAAFALAALIALTSVTMAVARGQVTHGDGIVICNGAGIATIFVDTDGNPIGTPHVCPDCALSLMVPGGAPMTLPVRLRTSGETTPFLHRSPPTLQPGLASLARGPPVTT